MIILHHHWKSMYHGYHSGNDLGDLESPFFLHTLSFVPCVPCGPWRATCIPSQTLKKGGGNGCATKEVHVRVFTGIFLQLVSSLCSVCSSRCRTSYFQVPSSPHHSRWLYHTAVKCEILFGACLNFSIENLLDSYPMNAEAKVNF